MVKVERVVWVLVGIGVFVFGVYGCQEDFVIGYVISYLSYTVIYSQWIPSVIDFSSVVWGIQ